MNFDFIESALTSAVAIVPIIIALVQVAKMIGLPNKYSPIVSLGVGIGIALLFRHDSQDMSAQILNGIIFGLSASGLYSGIKTTSQATQGQTGSGNNNTPLATENAQDGTKVMFVETNKEDNH